MRGALRTAQGVAMISSSFSDFAQAGREVLAFLHRCLGFRLWMITRTEGDDWIVLQSEDHGYGVAAGAVFRWSDSFCSEMVKGNGPRIAPCANLVPAYADAPIGRQVDIQAYVGLPLTRADGSLFGTLCAIDPEPQSPAIEAELELVEVLAALLSTVLQADIRASEEARRLERLQAEALTDELTGLYNRRAWDRFLDAEDERCRRYGHPAAILVVDLDDLKTVNDTHGHAAGDALIVRATEALNQAARAADVVARLGGDEFGVMSSECDRTGAKALLKRVRNAFADAGVNASIGVSGRTPPSAGLKSAWDEADRLMYQEKHAHRKSD
jgi:diguanylate cyclase (GGDEF)-like protein